MSLIANDISCKIIAIRAIDFTNERFSASIINLADKMSCVLIHDKNVFKSEYIIPSCVDITTKCVDITNKKTTVLQVVFLAYKIYTQIRVKEIAIKFYHFLRS
jgi:hypothetical protein